MSQKVHVYVGTSKGGFIFESDPARKKWQSSDIQFKGWTVMHMQLDPRDQAPARRYRSLCLRPDHPLLR